jgi:phosphatidate cytidylyltransferase
MTIDQVRITAVIMMGSVLGFHFFPALAMWIYQKRKNSRSARGVFRTYLIWYIMLPVLILPILIDQIAFIALCYLLSLFGFRELVKYTEINTNKFLKAFIQLAITAVYAVLYFNNPTFIYLACISGVLLIVMISLVAADYKSYLNKVGISVYAFLYCGLLLSYLAVLRQHEKGIIYVFMFIMCITNNDGFSYITGSFIGRHKLVPNLSPHKSIEGTAGGIITTIIMAQILNMVFQLEVSLLKIAALGILLAVGGTSGDLVMSAVKRNLGLKDFGSLIPGHGGLLDRLDSLLLAAPLYYYFCLLVL